MTTTLPSTTRATRTKPANGSAAHRSHHAGQPGNGSSLSNGRMPPLAPLPTAAASPSPDEIAVRAYQYFEKRGCQHGHDVEHWLAAESSLRAEQQPPQP